MFGVLTAGGTEVPMVNFSLALAIYSNGVNQIMRLRGACNRDLSAKRDKAG